VNTLVGVAEARSSEWRSSGARHQETELPAMRSSARLLRAGGRVSTTIDPSYLDASQAALMRRLYPHSPATARAAEYPGLAPADPATRRPLTSQLTTSASATSVGRAAAPDVSRLTRPRTKAGADALMPCSEKLARRLGQLPDTNPQMLSLLRRGEWDPLGKQK